jgi:hypothetical protein
MIDSKLIVTVLAAGSLAFITARHPNMRGLVVPALIVAFLVNVFVPHVYVTPDRFQLLDTFSVFSFTAWTAGLTLFGWLARRYRGAFRWPVLIISYVIGLLLIEYVGYHLMGIMLTGNQPSLLGLGVLHGDIRLHVTYLLVGPTYLVLVNHTRCGARSR